MWNRIRAVIIEDEPLAAQYLAALLNDTYQVEVVGSATTSDDGLRLCAELRPDAVFVDINLPDKDGVSLAPVFLSKCRSPSSGDRIRAREEAFSQKLTKECRFSHR